MSEGKPIIEIPPIGLNIEVSNLDEIIEKLEKANSLASKLINKEPFDDYLIKVSDAATILGVNAASVNKLIKAGALRALKLGCTKIRKKELDRFMQEAESSGLTLEEL